MSDKKGEPTKKQSQSQQQQHSSSSSPKESPPPHLHHHHRPPPFNISPPPLYIPAAANTKRPRFSSTSSSSQWKLLSPTHPKPPAATSAAGEPANTGSSSDTATSSPTHSPPVQSLSAASTHDTNKPTAESPADDQIQTQTHQVRKGKFVSPVWKPNEMLWLAKAWRAQYNNQSSTTTDYDVIPTTRGKTRAEKDREVSAFLNRNGIHRDAKTAGTKWDNMLGEFRKVYEWERGGERDRIGKSYFRLSPYERKLHRLPASFDEEVFDELSQFMGSRIRSAPSRGVNLVNVSAATTSSGDEPKNVVVSGTPPARSLLLPPPGFKDDDFLNLPLSSGRSSKQLAMEPYNFHGGRLNSSLLGFDSSAMMEPVGAGSSSTSNMKELRRIGKVRMTWEESVSLWAEEGEHHKGRIKIQGSSFLNADELMFFDDSMVACTMESFEEDSGALRGFSVDKFLPGQHIKVFGRKKSKPSPSTSVAVTEIRPTLEYQDPTEYYMSCLRSPPPTLPTLFELSWFIQEPPPEELRFPIRKDVYKDLPHGKELFFTTTTESLLDSKSFALDVVGPLVRSCNNVIVPSCRDSFIGLWDDCVNRLISKFCSFDLTLVRKSTDQWPNLTGFVKGFCLWRGEEIDRLTEGQQFEPSLTIAEKLMWTYHDLPYVLGYYAVGYTVTFCAMCRSSRPSSSSSGSQQILRTDLYSLDLSSPSDRLRALVPCYRIGGLLTLLADRCCSSKSVYSDFERFGGESNGGVLMEATPMTMTRYYPSRRKWSAVKEIYDLLGQRIPHSEFIAHSSEKDLALVFKPRGVRFKLVNFEQLVESLIYVTKALVALHDLSFMHRDLSWEKVMLRMENGPGSGLGSEWFVCGFDEAVAAPALCPREGGGSGRHAPEMGRGLHGVKVDVWGVGELVRTCGLFGSGGGSGSVVKMLRELQNRCLEQNPELRPTAADCYHHLSQLQSSILQQPSTGGEGGGSY
ncbi:Crinkler effector protein 8 [Linum grandiflorum]